MIRNLCTATYLLVLSSLSTQAFAEEKIHITVKTADRSAAAIGYIVDGKASGTLGKSYSGKGLKNKKYIFGYRRHSFTSANITCGSSVLDKDTVVTIVPKGEECELLIN